MSDISQFTSVFRAHTLADASKVTKRNRQPVSCLSCRSRKLKCDRKQPCGACTKRGDDDSCRVTSVSPPVNPSTAPRHEVQLRLQKLEEMVHGLIHAGGSPPLSTNGAVGTTALESPLECQQSPGTTGKQNGVNAAYYGATHWVAFLDNIREIQHALDTETELSTSITPAQSSQSSSSHHSPNVLFGESEPLTVQDVLMSIPSRAHTDKLLSIYFSSPFSASPFIHVHCFRRQYEAFWKDPSSTSFLWISILFSILGNAAMVATAKGYVDTRQLVIREPQFYVGKAAQCLVAGEFLQAKPFAVEAVLIQAHLRNLMSRDSDPVIWSMIGLATRLAQRRGYHRDPKNLPKPVSPFEAEMRRRTWFYIEAFDLLLSFQLGMPAIVHEEECDTEGPSNHSDDDFDENTVTMPPPREPNTWSPLIYYVEKSKLCRHLRRIIRHALTIRQPLYSETLKLDNELKQWYADLPPILRVRPIRDTSFTDQNYTIMHRLFLELMYRKSLCVLHRMYLSHEKDNKMYEPSRKICRDSALRVLDLHEEFHREVGTGGRLYEDKFMLSSLTCHDFLIAAMVICLDLNESRDTILEDRARRLNALKTVYNIWKDQASVSRDAAHASIVLGAMIKKVSGQDPGAPPPRTPAFPVAEGPPQEPLLDELNAHGNSFGSLAPVGDEGAYEFDMVDLMPLDNVLSDPGNYDWNYIDQYLFRDRSGDPSGNNVMKDSQYGL